LRAGTLAGLLLALGGAAAAQGVDGFKPQFKPTLTVTRARGPIRIDGDLDDPGWKDAARAAGFAEVEPGDQVKPGVESEAWVTYDNDHLYFALLAHDDPAAVRVSLRDRDNIWSDDYFGIMLDTHGDLAWGYEIFVNPIGVQGDLRVVSDGSEDLGFDVVWDARGKITERGYQVEISIPFASLRFPDAQRQVWRVNFWRDRQRDVRRRYAWAAIDRDDPCWMCQWGTLDGIEGIRPGKNIDLIGSALGFQSGALNPDDPDLRFRNEDPDAELSLNVRYGLTSSASAEATLNPDFSQVESDAGQIDVNTPFALFFPERRPFFQEGSNLYTTWIDAIYTRSINNPVGAAKLSGTFGRTSALYLFGADDDSPIILPDEERSFYLLGGSSVSNIARLRRTYGSDSHVGALITDRRLRSGADGSGTVAGVDGRHRLHQNLLIEYQLLVSHTDEPDDSVLTRDFHDAAFDDGRHTFGFDGETFWGEAMYASLERGGRRWSSDIDYWAYSPTFRTDNGFTTRNDYRQVSWWNGVTFRPNRKVLITWEPSVDVGRIMSYDGGFEDEWIRPNLYLGLIGQTSVWVQNLQSKERFAGQMFPGIRRWTLGAETHPREILFVGAEISAGRLIRRSSNPVLGKAIDASIWGTLKPTARLVIDPSWGYSKMDDVDLGNIFEGYILRTRMSYQLTRELFLRFIVQYDGFDDALDVEPLFTYRINPFTVFFLGSTGNYMNLTTEGADGRPDSDWRRVEQQFFAKIQYLIRK
jgi:hypothetical protein